MNTCQNIWHSDTLLEHRWISTAQVVSDGQRALGDFFDAHNAFIGLGWGWGCGMYIVDRDESAFNWIQWEWHRQTILHLDCVSNQIVTFIFALQFTCAPIIESVEGNVGNNFTYHPLFRSWISDTTSNYYRSLYDSVRNLNNTFCRDRPIYVWVCTLRTLLLRLIEFPSANIHLAKAFTFLCLWSFSFVLHIKVSRYHFESKLVICCRSSHCARIFISHGKLSIVFLCWQLAHTHPSMIFFVYSLAILFFAASRHVVAFYFRIVNRDA